MSCSENYAQKTAHPLLQSDHPQQVCQHLRKITNALQEAGYVVELRTLRKRAGENGRNGKLFENENHYAKT